MAVPVLVAAGALWLASGLFDDTPLVAPPAAPASDDPSFAATVEAGTDASPDGALVGEPAAITEVALASEVAAALEATPMVRSRTVLSRHGVLLGVTRTLPAGSRLLGRYVNVRLALRPEGGRMRVGRMAVGRYEVPDGWIPDAFALWRRWVPGASEALRRLADIRSIDPEAGTVSRNAVGAAPVPGDGRG